MYLEQRNVVIMIHSHVVKGMRNDSFNFDLGSVVAMRVSSSNSQLNFPAVYASFGITSRKKFNFETNIKIKHTFQRSAKR